MADEEKQIREKIFALVKELYQIRERNTPRFIPGKSTIPYAGRIYDEKEIISLVDSALDFWLTEGRYAFKFEEEFSNFLGVPHTIITNSGSSANLLAIFSLSSKKLGDHRLYPNDEVIGVAASFPTTMSPIIQVGAKPILLDVELGTYNTTVEAVQNAITPRTKAIFLAHTLGNPYDAIAIKEVAEDKGIFLIEDSCDALGGKLNNKFVGTIGDIGTFSFYPAHQITMGEGGALVTKDEKLNRIIRSFRDWGRDCWCKTGCDNTCGKRFDWQLGQLPQGYDHKYIYSHIGFNLKVVDMQPAIGVEQLKKLGGFIQARRNNFDRYYQFFKQYENYFVLPRWLKNSTPSWFGFILTVREGVPFTRDEIVKELEAKKIATRPLFTGNLLKQPAFEDVDFVIPQPLDNTNIIMERSFWIGVYPGITPEKSEYVRNTIAKFIENTEKPNVA